MVWNKQKSESISNVNEQCIEIVGAWTIFSLFWEGHASLEGFTRN